MRKKIITPSTTLVSTTLTMMIALSIMHASTASAQSSRNDVGFADFHICKPATIDVPQVLKDAPLGGEDELPTNIEGDEIETLGNDEIKLTGNAQVVQGKRGVFADVITYNKETYTAGANGNVKFYTSGGDEISSESLELEVDTFIGSAKNAKIKFVDLSPYETEREHHGFEEDYSILAPFRNKVLKPNVEELLTEDGEKIVEVDPNTYVRARATASRIDFEGKGYEVLHDTVLTTCQEGNQDVQLVAKQIDLDHATGVGTAKSMKVKFKNIPIFYFPRVSFPINDERKTGFLFPGIGYDRDSGTILEVPYYINIAPTLDATVTPRILSERGVQVFGEFRYLTENSDGNLRAEFLPSDRVFDDEDRYAISFNHEHRFGKDWDANIDLQDVSDTQYLNDFSSDVDVANATFIPQRADIKYFGERIRFSARASAYELVNSTIDPNLQPLERLPELTLDLRESEYGLFKFGIESEYTNFNSENADVTDGARFRIKPTLSLPLEELYGFITPKFSVQTISYDLDNNPTGGDSSPSVSVPIFSIDSGLFFERIIKGKENVYLQTLEPRLFYVNIPERLEQEAFPDFDTGGGSTSSFSHFFRENRFFGGDRVGDTQQLTLGLTSRIIDDETGQEKFKISLGQVFFFDDREVDLIEDSPADTEDHSDFLAEASARVSEDWNFRTFARWSQERSELEQITFAADYYHSNRRNGSIRYNRNTTETSESQQLNFDVELPISDHWQLDAGANYSIEESELRSAEIGIAYDGCCWAIKLAAQRFLDNSEFKNRYIFSFELDDLGRVSSRL